LRAIPLRQKRGDTLSELQSRDFGKSTIVRLASELCHGAREAAPIEKLLLAPIFPLRRPRARSSNYSGDNNATMPPISNTIPPAAVMNIPG
jgi:hypothetical protein